MNERLYTQDGITPNFNLHPSPQQPSIIGLSGYAQCGKDTVGALISALYGHNVLSFSDILREFLYAQDVHVRHQDGFAVRLNDLVDEFGWEVARQRYPCIRILQQKTGQEAARGTLGEDVWVNAWTTRTQAGQWVNPSVRYPNEAEAIRARGGVVLRVQRPGIYAINDHDSDSALDDWDFDGYIRNDGTLVDLEGEVQRALGEFDG